MATLAFMDSASPEGKKLSAALQNGRMFFRSLEELTGKAQQLIGADIREFAYQYGFPLTTEGLAQAQATFDRLTFVQANTTTVQSIKEFLDATIDAPGSAPAPAPETPVE